MKKMTHARKVKLARTMLTPDEISKTNKDDEGRLTHEGIFTSSAWEKRKAIIAARVARKQKAAHELAVIRKEKITGIKAPILTRARRLLQKKLLERRSQRQRRQTAYARRTAQQTV